MIIGSKHPEMTSFITTMFVSPPFPDTSPKALPPVFTLAQSSSYHGTSAQEDLEESGLTSSLFVNMLDHTGLPQDFSSNARTRGQFKPRNANKGTSSYQLRQFAEATLGSGSLRKVVKLPEGEDLSEWLAVNGWSIIPYKNLPTLVPQYRHI